MGLLEGFTSHGDHSGYSGHTLKAILEAVLGARTMELNNLF